MLDSGGSRIGPGITKLNHKGYMKAVSKRNTVKDLLMMKRQAFHSEQKWACSPDDDEPGRKFSKCDPFSDELLLLEPPAPVNTENFILQCPPPPPPLEQDFHSSQQVQQPVGDVLGNVRREVVSPGGKMTLLHWQIQKEAQKVEGLSSEQLTHQDADGDTFLHISVAQGRRALSYVLADKMSQCGCVDMKEKHGQTPLHIAAATNHHLIIGDLLSLGAQINTKDMWGRSPLHLCAERGHLLSLQSICRSLIESGQPADLEIMNFDGLTPLHVAILSHNAVVKETRTMENPCLYMSKELKRKRQLYVEIIHTLLLMGASCSTTDPKSGKTCLHMAAKEANIDLLNIFLNQPTSLSIVNAKTYSGNTALHIASSLHSYSTQVEAVKLLMRSGADPGDRNSDNELPAQLVPEGPVGEKVRQILKGKHVYY